VHATVLKQGAKACKNSSKSLLYSTYAGFLCCL